MSDSVLAWTTSREGPRTVDSPGRLRERLHQAEDERCHYCRVDLPLTEMTIDHIVPRAFGGVNHHTNYVGCCGPCNGKWGAAVRKCGCAKCERALQLHLQTRSQTAATGPVPNGRLELKLAELTARLLETEEQLQRLLDSAYDKNLDPEAAALAGKCKGIRIGIRYLREVLP